MSQEDYNYSRVRRVVERYPVSPTDLPSFWRFFKEINARRLRNTNGDSRKIKIDEIKAKYQKQCLKTEALNDIARLVFPETAISVGGGN